VEEFLTASRVLVAVATGSLTVGNADITLAQYRTLVLLASRGPQRVADLAELLAENSSNATRNCDRLQRRGLVRPDRDTDDRRAVRVWLTPAGGHLVRQITIVRRAEINRRRPVSPRPGSATTSSPSVASSVATRSCPFCSCSPPSCPGASE
jgi:DNA-binding MarR family transcriptional regulator